MKYHGKLTKQNQSIKFSNRIQNVEISSTKYHFKNHDDYLLYPEDFQRSPEDLRRFSRSTEICLIFQKLLGEFRELSEDFPNTPIDCMKVSK